MIAFFTFIGCAPLNYVAASPQGNQETLQSKISNSKCQIPKWFEKLTILSQVEGQIQNTKYQMSQTAN